MLAFGAIGLPWWWAAGFVVGLLTALPVVGFLVGSVIPVGMAIGSGGGLKLVLCVLGVMIVGQALETFYIGPRVLGRELDISPFLVFAATMMGTIVLGPIGTIVAEHVAAIAMTGYR